MSDDDRTPFEQWAELVIELRPIVERLRVDRPDLRLPPGPPESWRLADWRRCGASMVAELRAQRRHCGPWPQQS